MANWVKWSYVIRAHHDRFVRYIKSQERKLVCQECGGGGGWAEPILDDGTGPWEQCGWCEGTGYMTRWSRGLWLRYKRELLAELTEAGKEKGNG